MKLLRPLPTTITRPLSYAAVAAWIVCMSVLVNREYLRPSTANLATDLARYGPTAMWRGVYYRGEKIGFTVSQTLRTDDGFELQEDGRLQMSLLGATTAAIVHTTARVSEHFALRSFEFSLDPGTGPMRITGNVDEGSVGSGRVKLVVAIAARGAAPRSQTLELAEAPVLMLNLWRTLASTGLEAGARHRWVVFDPATLRNSPVDVIVGRREVVRAGEAMVPAFRVDMAFGGLESTAWVTDTGEIVREESPLGLMTIRESPERAQALGVPSRVQTDLLRASAVVPVMRQRLDEPRDVRRLRVRLEGVALDGFDIDGVGQTRMDDVVEITDAQSFVPGAADATANSYLTPEPLIESDDPDIRAEAERAVAGVSGNRLRAERLTRYVNGLLDKKPTLSLPSAREVLRTKVGDCNEHTALYVAMARAIGIPARIAVGLVFVRGAQGAFYYHAWPEVYLDERHGRGYWLPVDPTFNEFPANATHLRLARGGLDKQAAIVPLIGRLKMTVLDMELAPTSTPVVLANQQTAIAPLQIEPPRREPGACRCNP